MIANLIPFFASFVGTGSTKKRFYTLWLEVNCIVAVSYGLVPVLEFEIAGGKVQVEGCLHAFYFDFVFGRQVEKLHCHLIFERNHVCERVSVYLCTNVCICMRKSLKLSFFPYLYQ